MLNATETPSRILLPLLAESLQAKAILSAPFNANIEEVEATIVPTSKADKKWRGKMRLLDAIHSEKAFKAKLKKLLDNRKIHHSNEDKTIDEEEATQDWNEATTLPFFA